MINFIVISSSFSSLSYILKFFLLFLVRIIPNTPLTMAWPITPRAMWNLSMKHVMAMLSRVKFKLKDIPKTSFFTLSLCYLSLSFFFSLSLLQVSTRWLSPMAPFALWTILPIPFTVSMPWWPSLVPLCMLNRWLRSPLWPTSPFWPTTNHMWLLWLPPLWLPHLRPMVSEDPDWYILCILPISD